MSSELRVDKIIPTTGVPTGGGGGVIQVVQKLFTSTFTSSVYAYTDVTGFSIDITPKFSTSKILCFGHLSGDGRPGYTRALYRILRTVSGGRRSPSARAGWRRRSPAGVLRTGGGRRSSRPRPSRRSRRWRARAVTTFAAASRSGRATLLKTWPRPSGRGGRTVR